LMFSLESTLNFQVDQTCEMASCQTIILKDGLCAAHQKQPIIPDFVVCPFGHDMLGFECTTCVKTYTICHYRGCINPGLSSSGVTFCTQHYGYTTLVLHIQVCKTYRVRNLDSLIEEYNVRQALLNCTAYNDLGHTIYLSVLYTKISLILHRNRRQLMLDQDSLIVGFSNY